MVIFAFCEAFSGSVQLLVGFEFQRVFVFISTDINVTEIIKDSVASLNTSTVQFLAFYLPVSSSYRESICIMMFTGNL